MSQMIQRLPLLRQYNAQLIEVLVQSLTVKLTHKEGVPTSEPHDNPRCNSIDQAGLKALAAATAPRGLEPCPGSSIYLQ